MCNKYFNLEMDIPNGSSGITTMDAPIDIHLTEGEFRRLDHDHPYTDKNKTKENRALDIVIIYLEGLGCKVEKLKLGEGVDLIVTSDPSNVVKHSKIEVKGTDKTGNPLNDFRVSSEKQFKEITENNVPVYRVMGIFDRTPKLYILYHGPDFELFSEFRCRVKRVKSAHS